MIPLNKNILIFLLVDLFLLILILIRPQSGVKMHGKTVCEELHASRYGNLNAVRNDSTIPDKKSFSDLSSPK